LDFLEASVYGKRRDAFAFTVKFLLRALSFVYRAVLWTYLLPFRTGLRKAMRLPCPVISVGNITVGGTGKTPVVQYICRGLRERGFRPAVLSYGYGGALSGAFGVVSDGHNLLLDAVDAGDEPRMLAASLPGVPVLVAKDRRISGEFAVNKFDANVLVLDDGFQVWKLWRDLDIVLLSASRPLDNGWTLPAGRLREPASALRRTDCLLLTGGDDFSKDDAPFADLDKLAPDAAVYRIKVRALNIRMHSDGRMNDVGVLRGRRVLALSAIGNPAGFLSTLQSLDVVVEGYETLPDHHVYAEDDFDRIEERAGSLDVEFIATTEKDAVKLVGHEFSVPVAIVEIDVVMDNPDGFWQTVLSHIARRLD
jgi:tetraacyldisaccharide 4'-kinase